MGSNISKSGGECAYSTPRKLPPDDLVITVNPEENVYSSDPRSPHVCRTPIDKTLGKSAVQNENFEMIKIISPEPFENPSDLLKNKLIKELKYNLNDPRSPSQFINRTPIVFDESGLASCNAEESFNLDDKFSDLFIDNGVNGAEQKIADINERDPRSPSDNVERTPIMFTDDAPNETEAIENVLESLSLSKKVHNKPLDRVKNPKRARLDKKKTIYEDNEQVYSTPKRAAVGPVPKRTPLSCVANKSHLRSRSVENSNKSKRPKLPPLSYDDNGIKLSTGEELQHYENTENAF